MVSFRTLSEIWDAAYWLFYYFSKEPDPQFLKEQQIVGTISDILRRGSAKQVSVLIRHLFQQLSPILYLL